MVDCYYFLGFITFIVDFYYTYILQASGSFQLDASKKNVNILVSSRHAL